MAPEGEIAGEREPAEILSRSQQRVQQDSHAHSQHIEVADRVNLEGDRSIGSLRALRAKALSLCGICGTAEAVPCYKAIQIQSLSVPCSLLPAFDYLGAGSGESASAYARTAITAAFSPRCFGSTLSKVSAGVWW